MNTTPFATADVPLARRRKIPAACGVYLILCTRSGESYVGASACTKRRVRQHLMHLRKGNYAIAGMQRAYDEWGLEGLVFRLLEACEPSDLSDREAWWIEEIHPAWNTRRPAPLAAGASAMIGPATLGAGVPGTNLIRRFRASEELPPVYVSIPGEGAARSLLRASQHASAAGYERFHFRGETHFVSVTDRIPASATA